MKVIKNILLTLLIAVISHSGVVSQQEIRFTDGSLAAILSIAKDRNKNVFIDTYAAWCIPCKRMEEKFKNRDVAQFFNDNFVNYRVNMQNPARANELRKKYDVVFLPTMYILDPDGAVKYHTDKELSIEELLMAGQRSLDPTSYNVSNATSVKRKDGTITGGISSPRITQKKSDNIPKNIEPKEVVVAVQKQEEPKETKPPSVLDGIETIDESSERVLHVLGTGEKPPEILKQEAYLRLEFMDGSHRQIAKDYLATQTDWNTIDNRKFILDFVSNTNSELFEFIVEHRDDFDNQFGESKIMRTLEILTYRTMFNAVPRPTLEEALVLNGYLNEKTAKAKSYHYYINRLISQGETEEIHEIAKHYLKDENGDHEMKYTLSRYLSMKDDRSKKDLKEAVSMMKDAVALVPNSLIYFDLLGSLYVDLRKDKKAKKAFKKAVELAKAQGTVSESYEAKIAALESN